MKKGQKGTWLALAITTYLLGGGTVWGASIQTGQMVTAATNHSTSTSAYDNIAITQNSVDSSVGIDGRTVYLAIGQNSATESLDVYLASPSSGNYNMIVSNDGSQNLGRVMAAGIGSIDDGATTIRGPVSMQVTAVGAGEGKAVAEAIGIGVNAGTITTDAAMIAVTATGGSSNNEAKAIAHGIINDGGDTGIQPVVIIGTPTGSNAITASATGGTAIAGGANAYASAYGVENHSTLTLNGTTTLGVKAKGGLPQSGTSYTPGDAYGEAYGFYNAGNNAVIGTIQTGNIIIDYVEGTGTLGSDASGLAVGIYNDNAAQMETAALTMNNVSANGGMSGSGGTARAKAYGVENLTGAVTSGTFDVTVKASGGISDTDGTAEAYGLLTGQSEGDGSSLIMGKSGNTNHIAVTSVGGSSSGSDENNAVSASAYGLYNSTSTTLSGITDFSVQATGGRPFEGSNMAGDAYGVSYGIYNQGTSLITDDLQFSLVSAKGNMGSNTYAESYGFYNGNSEADIKTGNLTFASITATGGNSSDTGEAYAKAAAITNENGGTWVSGSITGTVVATGGSGPIGDAEAIGIYNSGLMTAAGVTITTTANGGTGSKEAMAMATGIDNNQALLTVTTGANTIISTATGGKSVSDDETGDVSATAYGIHNKSDVILNGTTTIRVNATGGQPAAVSGEDIYMAGTSYGIAEGIFNEGTSISMENLLVAEVAAKGGTGSDAHAEAYGMNNAVSEAINTGTITFTTISATGGNASTTGDADAVAYLLENNNSGSLTAKGTITGTVSAEGGHGPEGNASAYGIDSNGTVTGTNVELAVTAVGGTASESAAAEALGIRNAWILSMSSGNNNIVVTAQGGTSSDAANVNAEAYGILNQGNLMLTGPTVFSVQALGGKPSGAVENSQAMDASAQAYGLYNQSDEVTTDSLSFTAVKALGGTGDNAYASATGIYNEHATHTITADSITMQDVLAIGGNGSENVYASAFGIQNTDSTLETTNENASNILKVQAIGGTITSTTDTMKAYAEAYGISNEDNGKVLLKGSWNIDARAVGGGAGEGIAASNTSATAVGIMNTSEQGITVEGPLSIYAGATGVATGSNNDIVQAAGIYSSNGLVQVLDSVTINASAIPAGTSEFMAASIYAAGAGFVNVGTEGSGTLGKTVQLNGDVSADNAIVNVTLDQSTSYLQGNVKEMNDGIVNLVVSNGAVWKPVYDNRYGSFYDVADSATYKPDYTVAGTSINGLVLSGAGIADLTWDNRERDPAITKRTLAITKLSGDEGIFKVNTNLTQNIGDEIILGSGSTSARVGIDVAYDPYLAATNLSADSSISGNARVLTDNSHNLTSVIGVTDSYNMYEYTPTITDNKDSTYSVTKLTITNVKAAPTPEPGKQTITGPSRPMRDARQDRMVLHNLWVNGELNNMTKRMGDLRGMEPTEAGIWARYEHNKLEHGDNASLKYNLFQVGYDNAFAGSNGTTYRGAAVSYAKGTGDYELAGGDVKETALSLYQTGVGKDGRYYDIILKGGKLMSNYNLYNTSNPSNADYSTWGYSVSGELGKRFYHTNGVYIEPQVELTLSKVKGTDYTTSTGMHVDVDSQNTALARIGVAIGKEIKNVGSYYFKASYYHDFGAGIRLTASDDSTNLFSYGENGAKNWYVFTLGGTAKIGKNCNIFGEFSKYTGQLTNSLQYNVGARWMI